ncbi:MAG: hypothetical protein KDA72_15895, partial [Planctomycetales bacterium]|nr:hypothetical protein [Planctomycetales bacterium]
MSSVEPIPIVPNGAPSIGNRVSIGSSAAIEGEVVAAASGDTSSPQRCFRLTLAYDGTNYFGWQRQPRHPSVQAAVEKAICAITGDKQTHAWASSRTDTGVHALGQSAVFTSAG